MIARMSTYRTCDSSSGKFGLTIFASDGPVCRFCQLREVLRAIVDAQSNQIEVLKTKLETLQEFVSANVGVQQTTANSALDERPADASQEDGADAVDPHHEK